MSDTFTQALLIWFIYQHNDFTLSQLLLWGIFFLQHWRKTTLQSPWALWSFVAHFRLLLWSLQLSCCPHWPCFQMQHCCFLYNSSRNLQYTFPEPNKSCGWWIVEEREAFSSWSHNVSSGVDDMRHNGVEWILDLHGSGSQRHTSEWIQILLPMCK